MKSIQKNGKMKTICTAGPKNYTYETTTGYKKAIVKGITLNNVPASKLNFDSVLYFVTEDRNHHIGTFQLKFSRNKTE